MVYLPDGTKIEMSDAGTGKVSDGYHSFDELVANSFPSLSWKSRRHSDVSEWPGWFIAGMTLPAGPLRTICRIGFGLCSLLRSVTLPRNGMATHPKM